MKLLCKYYNNHARLANTMQYLCEQPSFRFFCIKGMVVRNKKSFNVITDSVTVVVACVLPSTAKNSMMLFTSDSELRDKDNQNVELSTIDPDPVFYNLCVLLQEKYNTTKNAASVELKGSKMSVAASISSQVGDELQCVVTGSDGSVVVQGQENIRNILKQCHALQGFRYTTETADFQREVYIKRSRVEILKEISRYLNRTLVLVSLLPNDQMLEQYISTSGMLEVITKADGTRIYYRVQGSKLREATPFCVYQSTERIEDIIREQGRALAGDKKG